MRRWSCGFAFALTLIGFAQCLAQQAPGPAPLENLLKPDEAQKPGAAPDADAGPKPPAGTVSRPKDGVQHPDLDKAWVDYNAAVAKATAAIKATIAKQFDVATTKGDLDAAEKWQMIGEKFDKAGELPAESETKASVSAAIEDLSKARDELTKAYEGVVKILTMDKKIAEAQKARDESAAMNKMVLQVKSSAKQQLEKPKTADVPPIVGMWVGDNGWGNEFLLDKTARNWTPNGKVDTVGTWKDEGQGRYSARLASWQWQIVLRGNEIEVVRLRDGVLQGHVTLRRRR